MPPPNRFLQFFSGMGRAFLQTKFLAVGSSLGHLSMKMFSDRTYRLGSKIRQREAAGGGGVATTPPPPFTRSFLSQFCQLIYQRFDIVGILRDKTQRTHIQDIWKSKID